MQPAEESLDTESPIGGEPDEPLDTYQPETDGHDANNAEAYIDQMIRLLRNDGVQFPNNQKQKFATLDPMEGDILSVKILFIQLSGRIGLTHFLLKSPDKGDLGG